MTLYCATTNAGKLREFRLAAGLGLPIQTLDLKNIAPPEETGLTFEANAELKALYYAPHAPGPLFAEDSGLAVDALDGAPGIYSARYAGNDQANNDLLLQNLTGIRNREARYVCAIALVHQGKLAATFRGEMPGRILEAPQGEKGFGYDPLFYYPPFGKTLAEVDTAQTFEASHRRQALNQLFAFLRANIPSLAK